MNTKGLNNFDSCQPLTTATVLERCHNKCVDFIVISFLIHVGYVSKCKFIFKSNLINFLKCVNIHVLCLDRRLFMEDCGCVERFSLWSPQ